MKLSYYRRKRIVDLIITAVMLAFLVITLFPIVWMVYTSLKENNDILVGKIPLSHAHNDFRMIEPDKNVLWGLTSNGGISKFEKDSLKLLETTSAQTAATHFEIDEENIWISSSNRGLSRIGKNNLKKREDFKIPFGGFDPVKVVSTSLAKDRQFLWIAMDYKGFEKVIEFNKQTFQTRRVLDISNEFSPVRVQSLLYDGDILWVGTDKALINFNLAKDKVAAAYPVVDFLPMGINIIKKFGGDLVMSGSTGAFVFSPSQKRVVNKIAGQEIQKMLVADSRVLLGTNTGFMVYDSGSRGLKEYENLFRPVSTHHKIIEDGEFVPAEVSAFAVESGIIYAGSSYGRLTRLTDSGRIVKTAEAGRGHLVISWGNYVDMWRNVDFGTYLKNSFLICGAAMVFAMIFATLAAYAVARFDFPGSKTFSMTILATQMVPGIMFLIPIYSMFVKFTEFTGIPFKGTYFGIIFIYSAFFIPFSIWILRGFFAAIPVELEEAARIDGCNPIQVFWYVVLPLAVPGIIATGIWVFLTAWDELVFAWVLTSGDTMTIPVGIRNFVGNYQNRFDLIMAAATVATLPVMLIFFLLQKYIVKGLTSGAVKG